MTSVRDEIKAAADALVRAGLQPDDAAFDAAVLARHVLGWDRATLLTHGRDTPPAFFLTAFNAYVARRAAREPVAMILGAREFWGLELEVTPDVLVPRPETELILEESLNAFEEPPTRILDVGTGSGCLAIALACEFPDARILATDLSDAALAVAKRNAARHGVLSRVRFVRTSFFAGIRDRVDLIVANPPYMAETTADAIAEEVLKHEPHTALFGGPDGLDAIRAIISGASEHLMTSGRLIMEFGYGQESAVRVLAADAEWDVISVRRDLQGIPRVAVLGRP